MVNGIFYNITDVANKLSKTLADGVAINGKFYQSFDGMTPRLEVRVNGTFNFNYCEIDGKFYFIENVSRETNNVLTLYLHLDVLQTYREKILESIGTVTTRENANKFISNRENIYNVIPQTRRYDFTVENPFNAEGNIIMITIKGR